MISTFVAVVVVLSVACLVSPSYGQAKGATVNCYICAGTAEGAYGGSGAGCAYPFNSTGLATMACPGQCTTTIKFTAATPASLSVGALNAYGAVDYIVRGCTQTTPPVGCRQDDQKPDTTICVSVCSSDLCNSAVSLTQSMVVRMLAVVGVLAVLCFRRK